MSLQTPSMTGAAGDCCVEGRRRVTHRTEAACDWFALRVPQGEASRREAMGRTAEVMAPSSSTRTDGGCPVAQVNDLSRSLTAFDPISTLVVVVEMSKASWLVSGAVPGVERQPLKKLEPDAAALLRLIERWRNEAARAGRPIRRIALAYEAGRDGFWLARYCSRHRGACHPFGERCRVTRAQ